MLHTLKPFRYFLLPYFLVFVILFSFFMTFSKANLFLFINSRHNSFFDGKIAIRECAATTIVICLSLVEQRDDPLRKIWYRKLYDESCKNLKSSNPDIIHGSILAVRALVSGKGKHMDQNIREIFETLFKLREHKDIVVRKSVVQVLPDLAIYDPVLFSEEYLNTAMGYLLSQLRKEKDKNAAFLAVGEIAKAVGQSIGQYLEAIFQIIKEAFILKQY